MKPSRKSLSVPQLALCALSLVLVTHIVASLLIFLSSSPQKPLETVFHKQPFVDGLAVERARQAEPPRTAFGGSVSPVTFGDENGSHDSIEEKVTQNVNARKASGLQVGRNSEIFSEPNSKIVETEKQGKLVREWSDARNSSVEALSRHIENGLKTEAVKSKGADTWLTVGIPTVPRPSASYLYGTLSSLMAELPPPGDGKEPLSRVRVVVMNMAAPNERHEAFEELAQLFRNPPSGDMFALKGSKYVFMINSTNKYTDPTPDAPEPDHLNNPKSIPGRTARKQSCDVLNLLDATWKMGPFFMFMEDDFNACEGSLGKLPELVQKLDESPGVRRWLALRVSFGLNGILMRST